MTEEQLTAWGLQPHTLQGRMMQRLIKFEALKGDELSASYNCVSSSMHPLRRKLAAFDIVVLALGRGKGWALAPETRALLAGGALRGDDAAAIAAQGFFNQRFRVRVHQETLAQAIGDAYAARRQRAMAGDVGALGSHLVREIVAEVGPRFDSLSEDSARSYLYRLGLKEARISLGLDPFGNAPGAALAPKPYAGAWRPGVDPKPRWLAA